ncbi:hypothetical protein GEMRC1_014165 [Eukaryota sp. GEM-RC1]
MYEQDPHVSSVGIPPSLMDKYWRKLDDRQGMTDNETVLRVAENLAQRISVSNHQLITQVRELMQSHFDSVNILLPSTVRSVLSAAEQEQSMAPPRQLPHSTTPLQFPQRGRRCLASSEQFKKTSNSDIYLIKLTSPQ